ncbi:MAG: type II toxin-antitoxin system RelE/ParE family toxin [Deltaproteobacteria bacterium]|nr:type II toxin-antitoxin system RelE/ParE family toxin [Deltaproteobacteria bacterium]
MITVKFLPRAEKQLLELYPPLQDEILSKVKMLSQFPYMGEAMGMAYAGYRCLLAGRGAYRIVYKVTSPALVEIATIRHCRRQVGLRII